MKEWQIQINNNSILWREVARINAAYKSYNFNAINCPMAFEYSKQTSGAKFTTCFSLNPVSPEVKRIVGDRFDFGKYLVEQILNNKQEYKELVEKHIALFEIYSKYKGEIEEIFEKYKLFKKEDYDKEKPKKRSAIARFFVDDSMYENNRYSDFLDKQRYEENALANRVYKPVFPYIVFHLSAVTPWKYHKEDFRYEFSDIVTCYNRAVGKIGQMTFVQEQRRIVTDDMRYNVLKRDGFRCCICGATAKDGVKLEVDHIVPVSKGGKSTMDNLQTLCERCNRGKRDKI